MMTKEWTKIRNTLKNQLKPGIFQAWIRPLQGKLEGKTLILEAPNPFVATWIQHHMLNEITQAVHSELGDSVQIEVRASKDKLPQAMGEANSMVSSRTLPMETRVATRKIGFQWNYNFDDFIVGPSNEMAFMAASHFSSRSFASDQLFLSAPSGLGKTHLVHAIGGHMARQANRSSIQVACLSAEDFANQMIMALKSREIERFKARYRDHVDVLLLEDIHFFQGKEKIQDELICTLNALAMHGSKVVFTSTFLPKELKAINSSLVSRMSQGFMAVIAPPEFETRRRIVAHKARQFQIALHADMQELLAEHLCQDVRQIESCIKNLALKSSLTNRPPDHEMIQEVLSHYSTPARASLDLPRIMDFVCQAYSLAPEQLRSRSRKRQLVLARNTAFLLARKHTGLSLKEIGSSFNRRHSTVLKGITSLEKAMKSDTSLGRQVKSTVKRLDMQAGMYCAQDCK